MEKKKKTRFIVGWLLITAALLAGSLLVPGHGKSESVQEAMRDAVLHGTNRISLFGLKDVNPAYISSLVVVGVILLAALLLRLFAIPRFKMVPGKLQLAVETVVDPEALEKARAEAVAEMQDKLDKAREAKKRAEDKQKIAEEALEQARLQLEEQAREEKKAALGADKDLAQFELLFDQTKDTVNRMHGILLKVRSRDEDAAGRLSKALAALAEAVRRCAE